MLQNNSISFFNQSWSMISGEVEPVLCKRCGKEADLKADELTSLLQIDSPGEPGSNHRMLSEELAQKFESFIYR